MGILPRKVGEAYVIASDRDDDGVVRKSAPRRMPTTYQVWTGAAWSAAENEGLTFNTLDAAEEYIRANYARVMI